jgi:hypothetical protein
MISDYNSDIKDYWELKNQITNLRHEQAMKQSMQLKGSFKPSVPDVGKIDFKIPTIEQIEELQKAKENSGEKSKNKYLEAMKK